MLVEGFPARPRTVNVVALKRKSFSSESIKALMEAYRLLYRSRVGMEHAREILGGGKPLLPELQVLFDFIEDSQGGRHGRGRDRRKAA
jgi:UDP-N-acetylglucosamine acyltransferase